MESLSDEKDYLDKWKGSLLLQVIDWLCVTTNSCVMEKA